MARTSAMQHSLKHLRSQGWTACIVERWIPPRGTMKFGRRIDAFGIGDILACRLGQVALIQTTVTARQAEHRRIILGNPAYKAWKEAGGIILLHGWAKRGARGKRKTWTVREEVL